METWILEINCKNSNHTKMQKELLKNDIYLDVVPSLEMGIQRLKRSINYAMVVICSSVVEGEDVGKHIKQLRTIKEMIHDTSVLYLMADEVGTEKVLNTLVAGVTYHINKKFVQHNLYKELAYLDVQKLTSSPTVISNRDIMIIYEARKVFVRGESVKLTRTEFELLYLLFANRNYVLTYDQIMERIWHRHDQYLEQDHRNVWLHIKRLRDKLRVQQDMPEYIQNIRDVGYVFQDEGIVFESK